MSLVWGSVVLEAELVGRSLLEHPDAAINASAPTTNKCLKPPLGRVMTMASP
jgi:hypothetical protein